MKKIARAHTCNCKSKDLLVSSDTTVQMGTGRKNTMEMSAKEDTSISPRHDTCINSFLLRKITLVTVEPEF